MKIPPVSGRGSRPVRVDAPLGDFLKSKKRKGETMSQCIRRLLETPVKKKKVEPIAWPADF